jgi:hypothetical protein
MKGLVFSPQDFPFSAQSVSLFKEICRVAMTLLLLSFLKPISQESLFQGGKKDNFQTASIYRQ